MLIAGILIYLILFVGLMSLLVKVAPFGYEDKEGFHYANEQSLNIGNDGLRKELAGVNNRAA